MPYLDSNAYLLLVWVRHLTQWLYIDRYYIWLSPIGWNKCLIYVNNYYMLYSLLFYRIKYTSRWYNSLPNKALRTKNVRILWSSRNNTHCNWIILRTLDKQLLWSKLAKLIGVYFDTFMWGFTFFNMLNLCIIFNNKNFS